MSLRSQILDLAREFARDRGGVFVPGESYVPISGKVLDEEDLVNLIEASLDTHLTTRRFAMDLINEKYDLRGILLKANFPFAEGNRGKIVYV